MVAPLGSQPVQVPAGTPPAVRNPQAVSPAAVSPPAAAPASPPAQAPGLPNQASQNATTARQIAGFSNSVKFPGIISPVGKEKTDSMVQRMTRMLESMLNHPPQPSLLEPIAKNFRALTDQLMERLDSERRDTTSEPAADTSSVASEAPTADAPAAEAPAAEAPSAEGPGEAGGTEPEGGAESTSETGPESAGDASTETEASAGPAEADGTETESESTSGTANEGGGQDFAPTNDTRTQGDPNALQHYQALLSERYADLFKDLIGNDAYQKLQEMLSQYK